jgi:hypothetical protein
MLRVNESFAQPISEVNKQKHRIKRSSSHQITNRLGYWALAGNISQLNQLAREANADCIIHTGDFGFYGMKRKDTLKKERTHD